MKNLTISEAAQVCGYTRGHFYKIIKKFNITVKKDGLNKQFIDPSELCRCVPGDIINQKLLLKITQNDTKSTPKIITNDTKKTENNTANNHADNDEILFLREQLRLAQSTVAELVAEIKEIRAEQKLLEYKPEKNKNDTKSTKNKNKNDTKKTGAEINKKFKDLFDNLKKEAEEYKRKKKK